MKILYAIFTAILILWGFIMMSINIMRPYQQWEVLEPHNRTYRVIAGGVFFVSGVILLQRRRPS